LNSWVDIISGTNNRNVNKAFSAIFCPRKTGRIKAGWLNFWSTFLCCNNKEFDCMPPDEVK